VNGNESGIPMHSGFEIFAYNGKMGWAVPLGYALPAKTKLRDAWGYWLNGNKNYNVVEIEERVERLRRRIIRPFYIFCVEYLPCWKQFKSGWLGIFKLMMKAPTLDTLGDEITNANIQAERVDETYEIGMNHVLSEVEYIKKKIKLWTITTWSKNVHYSTVMIYGTVCDKGRLPPANQFNRPHSGPKRRMKQSNSRQASIRFRIDSSE
jgi:hypothetical protein